MTVTRNSNIRIHGKVTEKFPKLFNISIIYVNSFLFFSILNLNSSNLN